MNSSTARFTSLDGLRGLFAVLVVAFHLPMATHLFAAPMLRDAYLSVDFFFVLSGFVIAHAYAGRISGRAEAARFAVRRIGRIWPLHVLVLLALVLLELAQVVVRRSGFTGGNDPVALLANLFLLQAWGLFDNPTWNVPAWSISAEFFAYLAFALVSLVLPRRQGLAAFVIVLVSMAILLRLAPHMDQTARLALPRVCYGFFLGVAVYHLHARGGGIESMERRTASLVELSLVVFLAAYVGGVHYRAIGIIAPVMFAVGVFVFASGRGIVSRWLDSPPMQFLGKISLSIYLVHFLLNTALLMAVTFVDGRLGTALKQSAVAVYGPTLSPERRSFTLVDLGSLSAGDAATLLYFGVLIAISALTWRYIEKPGQALFGRLAGQIGAKSATRITAAAS